MFLIGAPRDIAIHWPSGDQIAAKFSAETGDARAGVARQVVNPDLAGADGVVAEDARAVGRKRKILAHALHAAGLASPVRRA